MSSLFLVLRGNCDLQKLGSSISKEIVEILRRQQDAAWSSHCATKPVSGEVGLLPEATKPPVPRMTLREYAHIAAADLSREVIYKKGKWRLAGSKDVSDDIRKISKEKFLELMRDAAKNGGKMSSRIPLYQGILEKRTLDVGIFTAVFNNAEIDPYLAKGKNEFSPCDVDKMMKREYAEVLDHIPNNLCARNTTYKSTGDFFSDIRKLKSPCMGECENTSIDVFECFLSTDTLVHEAHHANSDRAFGEKYGDAFDEGVTQYLASNLYSGERKSKYAARYGEDSRNFEIRLREQFDAIIDGYGKAVNVVTRLVEKLDDGENLVRRAYFQGKSAMDDLELAFDKKYGQNKFSEFLEIVRTEDGDLSLGRKRYKAAMAFLNAKIEMEED